MSNYDAIIQAAKGRAPESKPSQQRVTLDNSSDREQANFTFPLDQILERDSNTRELRQSHVEALAESITVLGLLEPLVVDTQGKLLAGGHRLAAIKLLQVNNPKVYKQHFPNDAVPIRQMGFDAELDAEKALQVEVAENEHRRDYTPAEVRALADRLRTAGYIDQPGRPAKGTKALRPALEVIIGKSLRTVQRYLNQPQVESQKKPRQDVMVLERQILCQVLKKLKDWQKLDKGEPSSEKLKTLAEQIPNWVALIEAAVNEVDE